MASQAVKNRNIITLKGSAQIVTEFFDYAVNSILYQRGVYPHDSFQQRKLYGITMMVTKDEALLKYMKNITKQMRVWLEQGMLQRLVLVVTSTATKEVLERWTFDVDTNKDMVAGKVTEVEHPQETIVSEIQAIIRQITASVSYLPLLEDACTFDLLVYTNNSSAVPAEWEESDARMINNSQEVKLRGFNTKVHKVDAVVCYKKVDD